MEKVELKKDVNKARLNLRAELVKVHDYISAYENLDKGLTLEVLLEDIKTHFTNYKHLQRLVKELADLDLISKHIVYINKDNKKVKTTIITAVFEIK